MIYSSRNLKQWKKSKFEFYIQDCGGNGDCLFHVLSVAFTKLFGISFSMQDIRNKLASTLSIDTITFFLEQLCSDQKEYTLSGSTLIQPILSNLKENLITKDTALTILQSIINKPGLYFQGTDVVLNWLIKYDQLLNQYSVGFVIFNSYGPSFLQTCVSDNSCVFILLYNSPNQHWQLASLKSNNKIFSSINKDVYKQLIILSE